jgi:hypothetical protein
MIIAWSDRVERLHILFEMVVELCARKREMGDEHEYDVEDTSG